MTEGDEDYELEATTTVEEVPWANLLPFLPPDVDRNRLQDDLVNIAYQRRLTVGVVYGIAYQAMALGIHPTHLTTFMLVHLEIVGLRED